ncbi:MbcA/ParS/Xre antitoxin family protein [uncultured Bosea sp.]|jgi:uncharacterized protein (DUF2384 family)|uniref:MbcA/ParS/Xre antitoxin family protein n=1 Tax=uncultured Bosea sp. TaxID=211457 RepID=UPI00260107DD|nr:MbcA/ParS/Xre antitoxin family protein [uncultured Bosea sp.]
MAEPLTRSEELVLIRTVISLLKNWSANDGEARTILNLSPTTYAEWRRNNVGYVSSEQVYRSTLLLQIHAALRMRFSNASRAAGWMNRPNDIFSGRTPLALIAGGELSSLERLLAYLAADLSPW